MPVTRVRGKLDRSVPADVWRHTLSQIPTDFGRLIYLASLRDFDTGRYEHHGLALMLGAAEGDLALRQAHLEIFRKWMAQPTKAQKRDLDAYLSALSRSKTEVISAWSQVKPYRNLVPAAASEVEGHLFCANFEALLSLLMNVYGVSSIDRDE
jgi:hypothetical protein